MERVSLRLEGQFEAQTQTWVERNVTGKPTGLRIALDVLADEGYVTREETTKGHFFTSVRPYREADDTAEEEGDETASPPRPHRVPSLQSTPTREPRPRVPLLGDAVAVAVDSEPDRVPNPVPTTPPLPAAREVSVPDLPVGAPEWEKAYWRRRIEGAA